LVGYPLLLDPSVVAEAMLSKLKRRSQDSCIMIMVDGAQKYADGPNFEQRMQDLVAALAELSMAVGGPMFICCMAATYTSPVENFFGMSAQSAIFLQLNPLRAEPVLQKLTDRGELDSSILTDPAWIVRDHDFFGIHIPNYFSVIATNWRYGWPSKGR